jgi:adenosine kinase
MKLEFKPIKIAVIGTLCRDKIILPNGVVTESFGGIAYSVLTLAALLESKAEIIPICNVGKDCFKEAKSLFQRSADINLKGLYPVEQKNNSVTLIYTSPQDREEILEGRVPTLSFEKIEPFQEVDYFLVNFISGWDINLEILKKLRKMTRARVYLDLHSLTLGIDDTGKRFPKKPDNWEEYVGGADYLQLNLTELETIIGKKINKSELEIVATRIVELGTQIVVVTLSDRGCLLVYRTIENEIKSESVKLNPVSQVADTTGCGDVFGAGFLAKLIAVKDPVQAAEFANHVAGLKVTFSGLGGLDYFTPLDLEFA